MRNVNQETKRVVGGSSFPDSIIRTNANSVEYVRYVASLISKKVLKNGMVLECVTDIFSISIMIEGKKLLSISIEDVEKFRQSGVLVFDKFIINMLHFANINIDETSSYYERVNQVIF